jgi:alpha-glucosidase
MRRRLSVPCLLALGVSLAPPATQGATAQPAAPHASQLVVSSPSGQVAVTFTLDQGRPYYQVAFGKSLLVRRSRLGFRLKDALPLEEGFRVANTRRRTADETWEQPWGEVRHIRNHFNELIVELAETSAAHRRLNVVFRAFDDGVGFRFEWPTQESLGSFQIADELTEFALDPGDQAWSIPAYRVNRYEYLYHKGPIAGLGAVHTPLTVETRLGPYISIHEAALTDYASMTLQSSGDGVLRCDLVPWSDGVKVKAATPFVSPWRTIQIADKPGDLVTSYLVLNLNEPSRIQDTSWIKPGKYVGIWWGMHLGIWTWASGPTHGATTERTKAYIDFAAKHGFGGVLVEGWNVGWDGNWIENGDLFSFTKPYPDFDLEGLARYAKEKGVTLIGHNETAFGIDNYERQLEDAFSLYERLGVRIVKTGYVDNLAPRHELHHGQYMVRHYRKVVEAAARHHIMLDVHEPIKDTGIRRTWPNMMSREGARGMEYNAWSADGGNPPEHETILPFTRLLAGPFDYTPGIFDLKLESAHRPPAASGVVSPRVNTTLAKSLANYVVIYSPQHMAADLIENYEGQPAFRFIEEVPTDWEETRVLNGSIGDYVTIARKDRHSDDWYVGSVTDEFSRTFDVALSFLDPGREYVAEIYADAFNADWEVKPNNIAISERPVGSLTVLTIRLAPGGGQAIRIRPAR